MRETKPTWQRHLYPTGVPYYTSDSAPGVVLEADMRYSTHVGMVFGQFVNEAGRQSRIDGWRIVRDGKSVGPKVRTLAEAKRKAVG